MHDWSRNYEKMAWTWDQGPKWECPDPVQVEVMMLEQDGVAALMID